MEEGIFLNKHVFELVAIHATVNCNSSGILEMQISLQSNFSLKSCPKFEFEVENEGLIFGTVSDGIICPNLSCSAGPI